ncbi:MAG: transglutaminase-like domain-containing protein [Methanobacteriaceae archaeon]|nr:transglutaminase-like domain-containing protein [Methanobacteriaceae archaeon]MDP2835420.1 transglutaminase-like domain-containing protein [Methanobacteriaceae archaeon]
MNQTSLENANQTIDEPKQNLANTSNPTASKSVSTSPESAVYNDTNNTNGTNNITYYNITVKVSYKYWYKAKVKVAHTKYVKQKYRKAYKTSYKTYYKYRGKYYTKYKYTVKYKYSYRWVKKTYYTYKYQWTYKIKYKTVIQQTTTKPSTASTTVNNSQTDYLSSTNNCQVTDSKIKSMAKSITSGATSYSSKATKIFNWVRDHLAYSFYYNTKYGAVKTLQERKGNCVDHAHLINALMRAVGINSRYVHVSAKFSSSTYGHVYSEVYLNGKWVKADATSSSNSLGVIKNWNLVKYKGTYASLPF